MNDQWNICLTVDCSRYGERRSPFYGRFCAQCGNPHHHGPRCCAEEYETNHGFCSFCGKPKADLRIRTNCSRDTVVASTPPPSEATSIAPSATGAYGPGGSATTSHANRGFSY